MESQTEVKLYDFDESHATPLPSNHNCHRAAFTSCDALLATYLAGCLTISLTIPYREVGFASVPGESFRHISNAMSQSVAAIVYFLLFFAIVMLSGSRLLVGFEALEHHGVFKEHLAACRRPQQLLEQSLRVACIVFAESLLIFATLPGAALFIALATCTLLVLLWDGILAYNVRTVQRNGSGKRDLDRLAKWVRTDALCCFGLVIGFAVAAAGRFIRRSGASAAGPNTMNAFDTLLITAAAIYAIMVTVAFVFEILDQHDIYGNALRVIPLSLFLAIIFIAIILLSGGKLKALESSANSTVERSFSGILKRTLPRSSIPIVQ